MAGLQGWIKPRFYHSFISKHCKWSIRQGNVQDSFWFSGCQVLQPLWTALGASRDAPAGSISSLARGWGLPSLHHSPCQGWGVSLLPSILGHPAITGIKQLENISANSTDLELITVLIWQKAIPLRSLRRLLSPPTHGAAAGCLREMRRAACPAW